MFGADTETHPIRHRHTAPRQVCLTVFDGREHFLVGNGDPHLADAWEVVLEGESVWHNAAYDLAVGARNFPHLLPSICAALAEGRVHDTKILEKLRFLATQGNLRIQTVGAGVAIPVLYDLASLVKRHLGKDRTGQKGDKRSAHLASLDDEELEEGRGDEWRYNFDALDGWKAEDYPPEARSYALEDAQDAHDLYPVIMDQLVGRYHQVGVEWNPWVESLHVASDFFLYLDSCHGVHIDLTEVEKLKAQVQSDLSEDKLQLLIAAGIMEPCQPSRPAGAERKQHRKGCPKKRCNCPVIQVAPRKKHHPDCLPKHRKYCSCPVEFTKSKKSSIHKAPLQALITQVCNEHGFPVLYTDPSDKFPEGQVSTSSLVLEEIADFHPVLDLYRYRQSKIKLLDVEIPRMSADLIHPHYDVLKSTGRTSCSASKLYPSGNFQNVDPRARACYVPPTWEQWLDFLRAMGVDVEGMQRAQVLLCSVDYGAMELVTLGEEILRRYGYSTLANQINSGMDPHAYLGAQIALAMSEAFRDHCLEVGADTPELQYAEFAALKKEPDGSPAKEFYREYRTFAKPTGLGYPGGLGPDTFVAFARGGYGLRFDRETAVLLREVWHRTYPEMRDYFRDFQDQHQDDENSGTAVDKRTGQATWRQKFWYRSPLGMVRRGCSYTEGVNGLGLQTPGAELAKMGLCMVHRAAYDRSQGSILFGRCRPAGFVHDEILSYVLIDGSETEAVKEKARLMVEGAGAVCPSVRIKAEGCLMHRWDKRAEPRYEGNRLVPWLPPVEEGK